MYSKTCLGRPPLGRTKCGLSRQVVSEARESRYKLEISLIFIVYVQRRGTDFIHIDLYIWNLSKLTSLKLIKSCLHLKEAIVDYCSPVAAIHSL